MINAGDILYSSWGYDQTNVSWYKVTARKGKRVYLQPLADKIDETHSLSMQGRSLPGEPTAAPVFYRNVRDGYASGNEEDVRIESYEYAYPWDGQPKHCSWYA